jgi:hypothetical protein
MQKDSPWGRVNLRFEEVSLILPSTYAIHAYAEATGCPPGQFPWLSEITLPSYVYHHIIIRCLEDVRAADRAITQAVLPDTQRVGRFI